MLEVFYHNGWLFIQGHRQNPQSGTIYFPWGEPTLSISANYGEVGDTFLSLRDAMEFYNFPPVKAWRYADGGKIEVLRQKLMEGNYRKLGYTLD